MNKNWESVEKIIDGVSAFCANDINPILSQLEGRTDDLKDTIDRLSGSCGLIVPLRGFLGNYKAGQLIAMDDKGRYVAASASSREPSYDNSGALKPGIEAFVIGMLLTDVDDNGTATVMCSGWTNDSALIEAATNNQGTGRYYLSEDGKASKTIGKLQHTVYCFSVAEEDTGSKLIFNPRTPEHNGHTHNLYKLSGDWEPVNPPTNLPGSIAYRINISNSSELQELLSKTSDRNSLIKNGELVDPEKWCIVTEGDRLFIVAAMTIVSTDVMYLSATFPLIGTTPVVRSVESSSELIQVYNVAGDVTVGINQDYIETDTTDSKAIKRISNSGIEYIPVVSSVRSGVGVIVSNSVDADGNEIPGTFDIHASSTLSTQLDVNITNLDGVIFGTATDHVSYLFPQLTTSALYGTVRAPHMDGVTVKGKINLLIRGSGYSVSELSGSITVNRWPEGDDPTNYSEPIDVDFQSISSTNKNKLYKVSAELPVTVMSDDFITIKLQATNPSTSITLLTASLELIV